MPRDQLNQLTTRYNTALGALVKTFPEPFQGSDLDAEANRHKAEDLCARVEKQLPAEPARRQPVSDESPATILAARLREALAANTIGGNVAVAERDARWKAAADAVKEAQAAWATLGPLPAELQTRFDRACRKVLEAAEKRRRS
jgi:hypothetical protein